MSDTVEGTYSSPKTSRYETTLELVKDRVITLNFDLVSGDSLSFSDYFLDEPPKDPSSIDPLKLDIEKCFMLRRPSKSSYISATETKGTFEHQRDQTMTNNLSNATMNFKDMLVSKVDDTLAVERTKASEPEIDYPFQENALLNATKPSWDRIVSRKIKKARNCLPREKTLECDVCKRRFVFKKPYERHLLSHREAKCGDIFKCDLCDKVFPKKQNVTRHFKRMHLYRAIMIYDCGECPKYFRSKSGLSDHKKAQHGPKDECFSCPTCGKSFTLKKRLKNHLKTFPNHGEGTSGWI